MRATPLLLCLLAACWVSPAEVSGKIDGTTPAGSTPGGTPTGTGTGTGTGTPGGTPTGVTTGTGTGTGTGSTGAFDCVDEDVGSAVGPTVSTGSTTGAGNDEVGLCDGSIPGTGNDLVFQWTASNSGCFLFDTSASDFDTVLYVREDDCNGAEIACNDDRSGESDQSEVGLEVVGGSTYLVFVDGYDAADNGNYTLSIDPTALTVWDQDLGNATGTFSGNTTGADDTLTPAACLPGAGSADTVLRWEAPSSDAWVFTLDTLTTDFDTVLSLHRQCADSTDQIACDDYWYATSPNGGESLIAPLMAGEEILIRVAGYNGATGNWTLIIN